MSYDYLSGPRLLAHKKSLRNASSYKGSFAAKIRGVKGLDRLKGTKILFKYGEERSIGCDCTYEEKRIFLGFRGRSH